MGTFYANAGEAFALAEAATTQSERATLGRDVKQPDTPLSQPLHSKPKSSEIPHKR